MPMPTLNNKLCINDLRHAEYYDMQKTYDDLFQKSLKGEIFDNLLEIITSDNNILLAYRNIKTNTGSMTAGTDNKTIADIGKLSPEEVIENVKYFMTKSPHGYRPKPVRRKDIPKHNGDTRPLGIPCIWDRLIQQCIKQVMEPICEAKFSNNSYGFRPDRSVEHAIARTYLLLQHSNMHYVVEFDIEKFFDNVNHSKLMKQIWSIGIHDKTLIYILKQMLKAPIKMPDNSIFYPNKGTPQGGIISPLLANIVLNELDKWIEGQWQNNPVALKYAKREKGHNSKDLSHGYRAMRNTNLKEIYIVRYADDFRIFCKDRCTADKILHATTNWIEERLNLKVSKEKTRIINTKKKYMEFLGFKIGVHKKSNKYVVHSYMSNNAAKRQIVNLSKQAKNIVNPKKKRTERDEIRLYNAIVLGIQNYYQVATNININCSIMNRRIMTIFKNRLNKENSKKLSKTGRTLTDFEKKRYGKSKMVRYIAGSDEPIYPIGYIKHKNPMYLKWSICRYTPDGRKDIHEELGINKSIISQMYKSPSYKRSAELMDNRISLFSAQHGKCSVTGNIFTNIEEIDCHHIKPKEQGGTDCYENLILILKSVHILIHAKDIKVIENYRKRIKLDKKQLKKLNELRVLAGNEEIQ